MLVTLSLLLLVFNIGMAVWCLNDLNKSNDPHIIIVICKVILVLGILVLIWIGGTICKALFF